ncbi:TrmH family RNA methyltransferase [Leucobacter denitrificans]|uniref:RNA methyltransferase n=1 Tax=Leucobacter denitrificans TaxID=683042 RepID=A0A7G9S4U0_9MICO|nr:RNA methyltransferase [Leucobacter denitrificans]QNN62865.1 RNA methyltransferase [Leucobacter denitrificans]
MSFEILDNPKAGRVKRAAALSRKKERLESGKFLVEGPQAVRELLMHRADLIETVFATTGSESWQLEIDRLASEVEVSIERVTEDVLAAIAETVQPQGVAAVARIPETSLEHAFEGARLVAVLHEVRDPGNAGTVLRAADAAGADAVIFSGDSIDPWHPKVVRSTTGSLFHLPVVVEKSLESVLSAAREAGLETIAADVRGAELTGATDDLAGPIAWVFGNEARGLEEAHRTSIGRSLKLPIFGAAESLNLATAASVLLYETAFAQRR